MCLFSSLLFRGIGSTRFLKRNYLTTSILFEYGIHATIFFQVVDNYIRIFVVCLFLPVMFRIDVYCLLVVHYCSRPIKCRIQRCCYISFPGPRFVLPFGVHIKYIHYTIGIRTNCLSIKYIFSYFIIQKSNIIEIPSFTG